MFFAEVSLKLCSISGHLALIADVNFTKDLATSIRRYLAENSRFIEFIYDLSEFANVASGQIVFIAQKKPCKPKASFIAKQTSIIGLNLKMINQLLHYSLWDLNNVIGVS